MAIATAELLLVLFLILPLLTIVAVVDLLRRPASSWLQSGQSQAVWLLVVVFIGFVGPILYFSIAKPKLDSVASV